jgi:excisionase family DNA binding protein
MSALVITTPEELQAMIQEAVQEALGAVPQAWPVSNGTQTARGTLSVAEAGRIAHRHPETIRRAINGGFLRASKPGGGREWLIEASELRRWMKAKRPKRPERASDLTSEVESALARVAKAGP